MIKKKNLGEWIDGQYRTAVLTLDTDNGTRSVQYRSTARVSGPIPFGQMNKSEQAKYEKYFSEMASA